MLVRANSRACYQALFDCGSQTITELASGQRFIGTDRLGFFGALHTWGRDFTVYNPHVHFVVPGGGVSSDGSKWLACPENFLLPEKAASLVFPGKFRDAMRDAGLEQESKSTDAKAWLGKWTVHVEPVGNGQAALKYLAPYVYRVAISNNRIESADETHVRFRYTPSGTKVVKRRNVTGNEFVRRFLQHTLPSRFQRIRYYGFASQNCKLKFCWVQMLVWFYLGWCYLLAKQAPVEVPVKTPVRCRKCGGAMQLVAVTDGEGQVVYRRPLASHALAYLDSG
jgi:hypothetical protein